MSNPKIQLTYLWTDETVMRDDFQLKSSRDMTEWASVFYRNFGFDVDVEPAAAVRSAVNRASKYALRKSGGIQPSLSKKGASDKDMALLHKLSDKLTAKRKEAIEATARAIAALDALDAHRAAVKLLLARSTVGMSGPEKDAHIEALKAASVRFDQLTAANKTSNAEAARVLAEVDLADRAHRAQGRKVRGQSAVVRSDAEMRAQMSENFKKDGIGDGNRLSVVFSRFEYDPVDKSPTRSMTYLSPRNLLFDAATRLFLWPYTYVIVDLAATVSSLAHEIVRAAGHVPPDAQKVFKEMEKRIRGLKQPMGVIGGPPRSMFGRGTHDLHTGEDDDTLDYEYIPRYEEIPGGFLDGPKNDIMNAGREDTDPNAIILSDPDKRRLLAAPFVRT
jgi:hypothetical protein